MAVATLPNQPRQYIYERPWIPPEMQEVIFSPERIVIVEGATKTAKTTTCMLWLAEQAMQLGQPGRNFWWVSSVYSTAEIAYQRLKRGLPREMVQANDSKLKLVLPNEAVLDFRSAEKPDNLYGEDVYAAVGDEVSRWREAAWYALRTTITATGAPVRLVHNVKGRKNFAYRLARRAEAGEPGMRHAVFTAYDAVRWGLLPVEEVEDARRMLPENVFRELYLAEPSDDGGNPFGIDAIQACVVTGLSSDPPVCYGVDLAKSQDWTVVVGLDAEGYVCRFDRWQGPWEMTIGRIRSMVGDVPTLVDSTGVGDPVLESLQEGKRNFEGFKFTSPSKQQLMEGLAVVIQQQQVFYPNGPIVTELESFEYLYSRTGVSYSSPEGMFDDCVCALALAVQHWRKPPKRIRGNRTAVSPPRQTIAAYQPR